MNLFYIFIVIIIFTIFFKISQTSTNVNIATQSQTSEGTSGSGSFTFVAQYFTDNTYSTPAPESMKFVVGGAMYLGVSPTTGF